jgi:hypothetical protein
MVAIKQQGNHGGLLDEVLEGLERLRVAVGPQGPSPSLPDHGREYRSGRNAPTLKASLTLR